MVGHVHLDLLPRRHDDDVFPDPGHGLVREPHDLESVTVQVDRMRIGALVVEGPAVPLVRADHDRIGVRIRLAVDRPVMSVAGGLEHHRQSSVGLGQRRHDRRTSCSPRRSAPDGSHARRTLLRPAYSTTMPMPAARCSARTSPRIQTPGRFISTIASTRSPGPRSRIGTRAGRHGVSVERDHAEQVPGSARR